MQIFKYNIVLIITLLWLSGWGKASTERDYIRKLPKHVVLKILQFVELSEYLEFVTVSSALYYQLAPLVPEQIYRRYEKFLSVKPVTVADLPALLQYSHFVQYVLERHPLVFFTANNHHDISSPSIPGSALMTHPQVTTKQIITFFQHHRAEFQTQDIVFVGMNSYSPVPREDAILPLVYDTLTERLCFCPFPDMNELLLYHVRLPTILVFTGDGNHIHTERMSTYCGKALQDWFREDTLYVCWQSSITMGRLHMTFYRGKLYRIEVDIDPSSNHEHGTWPHIFLHQGNDEYESECNGVPQKIAYTKMHAFYRPSVSKYYKNKRRRMFEKTTL